MKVYCKNCRYFVNDFMEEDGEHYSAYCKAPLKEKIINYIYGNKTKHHRHISVNNKDFPNKETTNGCKLYKRKWWNFWVKNKC